MPMLLGIMLVAAAHQAPAALSIETCSVLIGEPAREVVVPGLHVAGLTADAKFVLPDTPEEIHAVVCDRPSLVPAPFDYEVLQAGVPFAIRVKASTLWLEVIKGQLRVTYPQLSIPPADVDKIQSWLDSAQVHFNAAGG